MDIFELSGEEPVRDGCHEGVMRRLDDSGYSLVVGLGGQSKAISLMQSLGSFIKQYNGAVEHDVTYKPGLRRAMFDLAIEGRLTGREAWAEVMC